MSKQAEVETITTVRCGEFGGKALNLIRESGHDREVILVKRGDEEAMSLSNWLDMQKAVLQGLLSLAGAS